ncbi:MAG: DUF1365 domain-containing protein [Austwickia sp.]|nr:DUF1365 domain-containing protein [Austwickia sp.]
MGFSRGRLPVGGRRCGGLGSQLVSAPPGLAGLPELPALVTGRLGHARHHPFRHVLTYRYTMWLVDIDRPLRLPWALGALIRFDARDHLDRGQRGGGLRGDLTRFLERRGVRVGAQDRIILMAQPRVFGATFNPLSIWWVLSPAAELLALVLEVHNTYGGRHAYLVPRDDSGEPAADTPGWRVEARLDKEFYVSPFNSVDGTYRLRSELAPTRVGARIVLSEDASSRPLLSAWFEGPPRPATRAAVTGSLARGDVPQRTMALIRLHGVWLWLRRLPIRPRPPHDPEAIR